MSAKLTRMAIKVIIAAETLLDCQLLSRALGRQDKHFTVIACAQTIKEFLKHASEHRPDVAAICLAMQGDPKGGFKLLRELRAAGSTTRPILLLGSHEPEQVIEAFSAGAKGVICKTDPLEMLYKCIRVVHAGQVWASSQELNWLLDAFTDREPFRIVNVLGIPLLTPRQEEVVRLVAEGLPNREISSALGVSEHTVRNHLFRIYEKLGISSRVELILYALSPRESESKA
ncbi:MAG: response regulator transcription factor [Terriglobia bacterium]|jgi:DNA-binding NarL/FixJ family response regulator